MDRDDLVPLWRALADPKRRRIVQLLSQGARTTGELCAHFDVSRFAVMQHLKVLEHAGIIRAKREGRQRWNYLNQELFQRIQELHLDGERASTARLEEVLSFLARHEGMPVNNAGAASDVHIVQEVMLTASPEEVFRAFTDGIDGWWSHRTTADSRMRLEASLGGRLFEEFSDGGGLLYATVNLIRPGNELWLSGSMGLDGEIAVSSVRITLLPEDRQLTRMRLAHRFLGDVTQATVDTFRNLWQELLDQRLRSYVARSQHHLAPL